MFWASVDTCRFCYMYMNSTTRIMIRIPSFMWWLIRSSFIYVSLAVRIWQMRSLFSCALFHSLALFTPLPPPSLSFSLYYSIIPHISEHFICHFTSLHTHAIRVHNTPVHIEGKLHIAFARKKCIFQWKATANAIQSEIICQFVFGAVNSWYTIYQKKNYNQIEIASHIVCHGK